MPGNSRGCNGYDAGSANQEPQAKDPPIHSAASARHQRAIPNQHASCNACDAIHMYVSSKILRENPKKSASFTAYMHFATETSLHIPNKREKVSNLPPLIR